jgi:predicted nucleic acid-binding protein
MVTTVRLDASNRIVLSRDLRRAAGVPRGQKLKATASPGRIVLEVEATASGKVIKRGKLKLWTGDVPSTPLDEAVEAAAAITCDDLPGYWRPGWGLAEKHPEHAACLEALLECKAPFTNAHALAETFATLTGFYKVPVADAAELTLSLKSSLAVEPFGLADYETAIGEAQRRGVMGGGVYDSLHATFARRKGAQRIVTRNPSHFAHTAPELEIFTP